MSASTALPGIHISGAMAQGYEEILTPEAVQFVVALDRRFGPTRRKLLDAREDRQARLDRGELPGFLADTETIRRGNWQVAPAPADLTDRRVEITGPADRKMIVNAMNSGANVFMADLEDSLTPTWENLIDGQIHLKAAVAGTIGFTDVETGKTYALNEKTAVLVVRPRGWHLDEAHVSIGGMPISASIFDFGLYVFHNARAAPRERLGALLLPAEAGKPSRGEAVGRYLRSGRGDAGFAARNHPRDGADRNHPRRVRDGGDPLPAARLHLRAELRTLGLHLQLHQEVPQPSGLRPAGSQCR